MRMILSFKKFWRRRPISRRNLRYGPEAQGHAHKSPKP